MDLRAPVNIRGKNMGVAMLRGELPRKQPTGHDGFKHVLSVTLHMLESGD